MVGTVVKSVMGHDKDRFYIVVKAEGSFVYIADGKLRKLESPKRKNVKHVKATNNAVDMDLIKTDKQLKKVLWEYNYGSRT